MARFSVRVEIELFSIFIEVAGKTTCWEILVRLDYLIASKTKENQDKRRRFANEQRGVEFPTTQLLPLLCGIFEATTFFVSLFPPDPLFFNPFAFSSI